MQPGQSLQVANVQYTELCHAIVEEIERRGPPPQASSSGFGTRTVQSQTWVPWMRYLLGAIGIAVAKSSVCITTSTIGGALAGGGVSHDGGGPGFRYEELVSDEVFGLPARTLHTPPEIAVAKAASKGSSPCDEANTWCQDAPAAIKGCTLAATRGFLDEYLSRYGGGEP